MDVTTLALAVDSSQVNSASQALQKMAAEGYKAETVTAKLANTATLQGKALNAGIVKNAAAAADSIKGLTSATTALAGAQDFGKTTSSLAAAAAEASAATTAVRAFGAAITASAAAGAGITASFQAPKTAAVQQITQAPVSVLARSTQGAEIDSKSTVTASNALDKLSDQAAKAKNATEGLTSAAQAQGRVLGAGVAPNAEKAAASIKDLATAANSQNSAAGILATAAALSATAVQANSATAAIANMNAAAAKGGSAATPSAAGAGAVAGGGAAPAGGGAAATSAFAAAAAQATKQSTALGQANKLTAFQTQQLHYQLHDFFVQVVSGQSPLTAFVQQGSQLSGTFGGAGGALRAVTSLITPMTVGFTAAAAAVGTLGYAYYEGSKQSKAFADSLVLSGNFAGQTEGQFNALAKAIAASGQVTVGASREFAQALISTGQIGPEVLGLATEAAAKYGAATGKTADEVAADFAKMSRAPSEFAKEANRSLNNLTAAQYASMKSFEENGKAADAQGIFYKALIERLNGLEPNLTKLDRILRDGKVAWSNFWDAAAGSGRGDTTEAKLSNIAARITAAQRSANDAPSIGAYGGPRPSGQATVSGLLAEQAALQSQQASEVAVAAEKVKVQKQINQFGVQKEKLQTAADRNVSLTNKEEEASFRQLNDQIANYHANLLQMQGDELGAARARAEIAKDNAGILSRQSGGKISQADVDRQSALTEAANKFADVQRKAGDLAQNTARAEEAANLASEIGGKSLLDTENAVYAVRSRAVDQLGILATKARELADASTDPKIKQFAADLALQYAKAADAVDPALNRLRDAQKELAAGITGSINNGIANFSQNYAAQRKEARDETKTQKDEYQRRIDQLEGYLSQSADKNDKARLREKIATLQEQKDGVKGEAKGSSLFKTIDKSILQPMAGQALATVNKLLVTDPLQKYLEAQFKGLTENGGLFAGFFKDALGIKDAKVDPKVLAEQAAATATNTLANSLTTQTSAVQASTDALNALANAANGAAGGANSKPLTVETGSRQAAPSMGDFTRADRALGDSSAASDADANQSLVDARSAVEVMGSNAKSAGVAVSALAAAAGKGGGALGLLPSIINTISSVMAAFTASAAASSAGSSGSSLGALASIFGKTGASASAGSAGSDAITSYYFHTGGVVGGSARVGSVPSSIFDGAVRYHTGGIAGGQPDGARAALAAAALKHGEVPAILMKREEVLRRDDPRHRDNLGADLFSKIMAGEKPWEQSLAAQATKKTPDNSVASLLKNIAGDTKQGGENSASVLSGLLARLGAGNDQPALASALHVAGARELGGPVSAGKLYRVNEKRPELLNIAGKQYLMNGNQNGKVDPNPQQGAGGRAIEVTNNFHLGTPTNYSTQRQMALAASRSISDAARRNG